MYTEGCADRRQPNRCPRLLGATTKLGFPDSLVSISLAKLSWPRSPESTGCRRTPQRSRHS